MAGVFVGKIRIESGRLEHWRRLCRYHYCRTDPGPVAGVFVLRVPVENYGCFIEDGVGGVVVYGYCLPNCSGRGAALGALWAAVRGDRLAWLNRTTRRLARIVVHPLLRGRGLGTHLVRQTLTRVGVDQVECLARLGHRHPFLERAGMTPYDPGLPGKPMYYLWRRPPAVIPPGEDETNGLERQDFSAVKEGSIHVER